MSGIIGGAGSKSGVIGTTELNYEEGTWTPTFQNDTDGLALYDAVYRVVGDLVIAHFSCTVNTTSDASAINFSLPFTASVLTDSGNFQGGFLTFNNSGHDSKPVITRGAAAAHVMDNSGGYSSYSSFSGDALSGTVIYIRA